MDGSHHDLLPFAALVCDEKHQISSEALERHVVLPLTSIIWSTLLERIPTLFVSVCTLTMMSYVPTRDALSKLSRCNDHASTPSSDQPLYQYQPAIPSASPSSMIRSSSSPMPPTKKKRTFRNANRNRSTTC